MGRRELGYLKVMKDQANILAILKTLRTTTAGSETTRQLSCRRVFLEQVSISVVGNFE